MATLTRTVPRLINNTVKRQFSTTKIMNTERDRIGGMPMRTMPFFKNFDPTKLKHRHMFTVGFTFFNFTALFWPIWLQRRYDLYSG